MPYTHFQYIAYQVPTIALDSGKKEIYRIPPGTVSSPPRLSGSTATIGIDAKPRVERLIGAMIEAKREIKKSGDNNSTLKIFMAPEFYFRPDNDLVSYTYKQFKGIREVLQQTISKDSTFYDWLVVPGTIMWYQDKTIKKRKITGGESVYFNSAIYIQTADSSTASFFSKKAGPSHRIEKTKASKVDGIPTGEHGGNYKLTEEEKGKRKQASVMFTKYAEGPKKNKHVFLSGGIRFGLDICLDHNDKTTKEVIINDETKGKYVQLHLLTAGGQAIKNYAVAAIENGYILRTDGYSLKKSMATNCQEVESYRNPKGKWSAKGTIYQKCGLKDDKSEAQLSADVDHMKIDIGETHPLYISNPGGCDKAFWSNSPQQINIYERCDIPNK